MNSSSFFHHGLALLGMTAVLLAEPTPTVPNLEAWSVFGADKAQLSAADKLSLPASAQLYRTVSGNPIALNVESHPVFGLVSTELPLVELGDSAVAFARQGDMGKLVLVLGNNPALVLPYEIPLDKEGRSLEPLAMTVKREGATVAVTAQGQTLHFPGGYSAKPQELVLSAGAGRAWEISNLALEIALETVQDAGTNPGDDSDRSRRDQIRQDAVDASEDEGGTSTANARDGEGAAKPIENANIADAQTSTALEIFSPPSVRPGRAAAVRAAVIQSLQSHPEAKP